MGREHFFHFHSFSLREDHCPSPFWSIAYRQIQQGSTARAVSPQCPTPFPPTPCLQKFLLQLPLAAVEFRPKNPAISVSCTASTFIAPATSANTGAHTDQRQHNTGAKHLNALKCPYAITLPGSCFTGRQDLAAARVGNRVISGALQL